MRNRFVGFLFVVFTIFQIIPANAAPLNPVQEFEARVHKITLKNGLRVLVLERHSAPLISFSMYIRTGGLDDEPGKSGLAHMFEHMLFKGTKTIGTKDYPAEEKILVEMDQAQAALQKEKMLGNGARPEVLQKWMSQISDIEARHKKLLVEEEFWKIYERAGGQGLNASTGFDFTNYVISLPANQLPLWIAMETDRLKNPVLREFYKERDVVLEERRLRVDNSPSGKLWEQFLAAAFMAHPYGRPILGWESEISNVTRPDAEDFFRRHYDISRFVVTIVGDVDVKAIEKLMVENFESIPSKGTYISFRLPVEPMQEGEKRIEVDVDAEPSLLMGYHRPDMLHPDSPVFEVISDIFTSGRTSRFNRQIVEKEKVAVSAWASSGGPGERDANLFFMGGSPLEPKTTRDVELSIENQIHLLGEKGPTVQELEKVKNNALVGLLGQLASNEGLASQLGYYEAVGGDWKVLTRLVDSIQKVTAEDVKRVVHTYFTKSNKTVGVLVKKNAGK